MLSGCEPGYYWHLARGQARVVWHSEPAEEMLERPGVDSAQVACLHLVAELRGFAFDRLGLSRSRSYTRFYDTGGRPLSWNVSACPPDRFEPYLWHFPIVGAVPYKGFFDPDRARREYQRLRDLGLDAVMRPVSAYSTLGYLADPVLSTMAAYSADELAELILHELTHGTVYARGQAEYNESLATFVGCQGSLEFLASRFGPDSPELRRAQSRLRDEERFQRFMSSLVTRLDSLYRAGLPRDTVLVQRQRIFVAAQSELVSLNPGFEVVDYGWFARAEVNNAWLASFRTYHRELDRFAAVQARHNGKVAAALPVFRACAEEADPWACLTREAGASP